MKLYLASRSERRQQLLQQINVAFNTLDIEIDESIQSAETAEDYVVRMACEKAQSGKQLVTPEAIVIAADTSVVLDNRVLGKAETSNQATEMLNKLSGRRHEVMTAVAVLGDTIETRLSTTSVCFKSLSQIEIEKYAATDEPIGKAGAYAIQGYAATFIERIEGSYSGVMGLPLYETAKLLSKYY